ncbi:hypothetical protein OZN62_07990 [Aurantiacibacter sp. MUD11]|uniref:hypothetical protein n=1 Tax=Aurantiacibacter sp. MUD11 TaxID=3003265 RepID=UPI0022AA553B|nr:hypothetical protein [Aurantiacibacter sp. MUD11]WAT16885.1 hypothetical protein OZN62_07990 [Aurantiacibacter sp. MUD11]
MNFQRFIALACAVIGLAALPQAAQAQTDSFRIDANSTHTTELSICNPVVRIEMAGDGDTDLDFVITNSRGETVHSDYGLSDRSSATLYRRSDVQCEEFVLRTTNLGGVWNLLDVSLENIQSDTGNPIDTDSYRVDANSTHRVEMNICSPQVRIDVRGDGDTDLDFVIRNSRGEIVHSDYDLTDQTSTTLYRRSGVECEEFELTTTNLGDVYNRYVVQLEDVVQDRTVAARGSGDGYNRDISIQNRTGQTIMYLYWSNVAASNWGEDRLGSGVLANMQDWNVTVDDGSGACRFDFMARLADGRELEQRNVDVCSVYVVQFAGGGK